MVLRLEIVFVVHRLLNPPERRHIPAYVIGWWAGKVQQVKIRLVFISGVSRLHDVK